jgi:hypothetical protein
LKLLIHQCVLIFKISAEQMSSKFKQLQRVTKSDSQPLSLRDGPGHRVDRALHSRVVVVARLLAGLLAFLLFCQVPDVGVRVITGG